MLNLHKIIKRESPDIVFCVSQLAAFYAGPVSRIIGCRKRVLGVRGTGIVSEDRQPSWRATFKNCFFSNVCKRLMTLFVMNSQALADYHLKERGYKKNLLKVIYNGISSLADELGTISPKPAGIITVGIIGRLYPVKDHLTFLKAARLVSVDLPIRFVIIGNGPLDQELREQVKINRLQDRIVFAGWIPEVSPLLSQLDIVVLTSISEGFNNSIAEAQMFGIPVVTTDAVGCREIVEDGVTGFVVPIGDAPAIARAIERLASDSALRAEFGMRARERSEALFSVEKMIKSYQRLFEELVTTAT